MNQLRTNLPTVRRVFTFCLTDVTRGEDGEGSVLMIGGEPGVAPSGSTISAGGAGGEALAPTDSAWNFVPLLKLNKMLWWTVGVQVGGRIDAGKNRHRKISHTI